MPVTSSVADKSKIVFHAAMMAIQNFGFFIMYFFIWSSTSATIADCDDTRFATGFMAMTCFCVAFLCVGMGFGGYTDDKQVFTLYWFAHLIGGACYTVCTIMIPMARWSDDGKKCVAAIPTLHTLEVVYYLHAALYLVYVGGMLSITYFSFLKPTYFSKGDKVASASA